MSRTRDLLAALMGAQADGTPVQPTDGDPALGIPGFSEAPRGRTWDALTSAHSPDLTGDAVAFVALEDGTLVVEDDVPEGSLTPLADAIEAIVPAPYRAAALRTDDDVWSAVAERVSVVGLPGFEGDTVDLTIVGGVRDLSADGEPTSQPVAPLDALADEHGDVSIHGERVDGDLFAVDVYPL